MCRAFLHTPRQIAAEDPKSNQSDFQLLFLILLLLNEETVRLGGGGRTTDGLQPRCPLLPVDNPVDNTKLMVSIDEKPSNSKVSIPK